MFGKWKLYLKMLLIFAFVVVLGIGSLILSARWVENHQSANQQEEFLYKETFSSIGTEMVGAAIIFFLFEIALMDLRKKAVEEKETAKEIMEMARQGKCEELKRRLAEQALREKLPKILEHAEMTAVLKCLVG